MPIRYTKNFLEKLETLFIAEGYQIRYEKGNFKAGYCLLNASKIIVINKYFTLEGRINALVEILKTTHINGFTF